MESQQLSLGIRLRDDATLVSFYPGKNKEALAVLNNVALGKGEPYLYLFGDLGSGKTHLLQGACQAAHEYEKTSFYLSFADQGGTIKALEGLENIDLVCLDDIDEIAGKQDLEQELLNAIDRLHVNGVKIIVAAKEPASHLPFVLDALKMRLGWGLAFKVHGLDETEKQYALQLRANVRGIELNEKVSKYIVSLSSDMNELYAKLNNIDEAQMKLKKKISLSFVKEVLED